jgi:hypothetical protein
MTSNHIHLNIHREAIRALQVAPQAIITQTQPVPHHMTLPQVPCSSILREEATVEAIGEAASAVALLPVVEEVVSRILTGIKVLHEGIMTTWVMAGSVTSTNPTPQILIQWMSRKSLSVPTID